MNIPSNKNKIKSSTTTLPICLHHSHLYIYVLYIINKNYQQRGLKILILFCPSFVIYLLFLERFQFQRVRGYSDKKKSLQTNLEGIIFSYGLKKKKKTAGQYSQNLSLQTIFRNILQIWHYCPQNG